MSHPEVLKLLRKCYCYNLTIALLAEQIGVSKHTIEKAERGDLTVSFSLMAKLAVFYNIPQKPFAQLFYLLSDYDFSKPSDYQRATNIVSSLLVNKELPD